MAKFRKGKRPGFIDTKGNVVIESDEIEPARDYEGFGFLSDGAIVVSLKSDPYKRYTY